MNELFADRLLSAISTKGSPICVGIDPILENFPDAIRPTDLNDATACVDAIFSFTTRVLKIVAPYVPVVKFQSAYFEKYLWEGVEAYYSLIAEAKELGLLVIGDVKRGDIGSTAGAYSMAHLAEPVRMELDEMEGSEVVTPDAITVNPMMGLDTLQPFIDVINDSDKGLFVLVRTSNPGSAQFQDVKLEDGRTWSEMLADALNVVATQKGLIGTSGYSSLGAVVGATQTHTMQSLRKRLPHSVFLLPGYGTQGATADMTRAAFVDGRGAIVSASRSILYAHADKKYASISENWEKCVERAVLDMKLDLHAFVM